MSVLEACCLGLACAAAQDGEFFERDVRPILVERCLRCHGEERAKSDLRLDSREAILLGGKRGPAAVPDKPAESRLLDAVRRDGELKMPPAGALPADEIATLSRWIELGLPWPATTPLVKREPADGSAELQEREFTAEERAFWAFQPLADPTPPEISAPAASVTELDRFVLAELERHELAPAPRADRRTLLRRATFDLTGLPPTPEQLAAFLADESPDSTAFARVVERLLASPAYGERWARHWLDVVRYTDSFDDRSKPGDAGDVGEAWRYRDWVVRAIASDLPFSEFVQDQIAGDLRAESSAESGDRFDPAKVVATGMLAIGEWGGGDSDKEKLLTDIADDQVNVISRGFLGLTIGCARCHDHKFDPITTADYYGLAGIFFSSHILPEVGAKTAGPPLLHIPIASSAELAERARRDARAAELNARVAAAVGGSLLGTFAKDVAGIPGVVALKNGGDTPSLTANSTAQTTSFVTVTLPPRSVALHPSPSAGIAAIWEAPEDATLTISGRVADADAVCGDGIEWTLERRSAAGVELLVRGAIDNGGAMEISAAEGATALAALPVRAGDELRLTVLPRAAYECDTTVLEWRIAESSGALAWSLTDDVLGSAVRGAIENPLPAAGGASWRFVDRGSATLDAAAIAAASAREPALAAIAAELEQLRASAPPPLDYAVGAREGGVPNTAHAGVHDVAIHVRGRYDRLGAIVPRRFPRILAGDVQPPITEGSGRRELAAWLASPEQALPARVFVNRVWQHHFGAGLVRGGNFGRLGEPPSHPQLLDWLARRFLEGGGSLKALHRLILASSTWQQSSVADAAIVAADPDNRWLARMRPARLQAEELRDSLLAVSGELDATLGGPSLRDPKSRRRTLYTTTVRSDRSTFRALFDGADPGSVVDARNETTVAPQALWMLNDEFVLDRAQALARRVDAEAGGDRERGLVRLFELALARAPDDAELAIARTLVERGSLEELAHVLLCSNEFLFVD